jgi:hypothetical protein
MGRFRRIMAAYETKPMPVNHEVKGQLARLLATEDLVVEHKHVPTACFNVDTRVLTLPMWEKASNAVYDMLVGHEVGHALYTPNEDWSKKFTIPQQFVNVTEDARIEKMMKRRYAGLNKSFFAGYTELHEEDFFQIKDDDLSTYNLADRANLWFKIGGFTQIPIERGEEMEIINMIADAETFDDAIAAAVKLYEYCKRSQKEETKIESFDDVQSAPGSGSETMQEESIPSQENDLDTSGEGGQASSDGQSEDKSDKPTDSSSNLGGETAEPEVKTADNLEEAIRDLVSNNGYENIYLELPKLNLDTIIASNSEVHKDINDWWNQTIQKLESLEYPNAKEYLFGMVDKEYREFKRSAQKEVNYLVKEFECKKAADSYARATTARTGVLDCSKLHSYKYNEDLFRKVTTLANGKNHGLVFVLDWSGSMSNVMLDTLKQLYNLMWFCKKVAIPFEVYAFTHEWRRYEYDENHRPKPMAPHYEKKNGLLQVDSDFALMNLFTSKVNNRVLEEQMINIFRLAKEFKYSYNAAPEYTHPPRLSLSGTPLNEALITMHQILPQFQRENKLQKVQCVVLTDGEAAPLKFHKEFKGRFNYDTEEVYIGLNAVGNNTILRDRKLGCTYKLDGEFTAFTDVLLRHLRDKFTDVNFIGIRVLEGRDAGNFIRRYYDTADYSTGRYQQNKEYNQLMDDWRKNKSFAIKKSGYHVYFGLSGSALSTDAEFEVSEDASKTQIRSAFAKSLKSKKMNKKVLGEFIELVA